MCRTCAYCQSIVHESPCPHCGAPEIKVAAIAAPQPPLNAQGLLALAVGSLVIHSVRKAYCPKIAPSLMRVSL